MRSEREETAAREELQESEHMVSDLKREIK